MQTITPRRYREAQPEDRVTMASLLQLNHSPRSSVTVLERSSSNISREQRRDSDMNITAVVERERPCSPVSSQGHRLGWMQPSAIGVDSR